MSDVVVLKANSHHEGIRAEYVWLYKNFPGAEMKRQSLVQEGEKWFDILEFESPDGPGIVKFDISDFFPPKV